MADPGRLVGRGRAADVFDLGDGRVLRRYRTAHDSVPEATAMRHLARHRFPVPAVHDADGPDLVMDLVVGPSQLEDIERRPWHVGAHGRTLADLHRRLDDVPPLPGTDGRIVHLDLHPGNVLCTAGGPVVIDWSNVRAGDRAEDVATTWLLLAVGQPDGGRALRLLAAVLRARLLRAFLGAVDVDRARRALPAVCEQRLHDPNMGPTELEAIRALAARTAG